jgi:S-adenosylmethionine hydrolase
MRAPLITLSSDIGQPDYLVGAIKATLLKINPDFQLIDITHQIPPRQLHAGRLRLRYRYPTFP